MQKLLVVGAVEVMMRMPNIIVQLQTVMLLSLNEHGNK